MVMELSVCTAHGQDTGTGVPALRGKRKASGHVQCNHSQKGLTVVSSSGGGPSNSLSWTALLSKMAITGMESQHWFGWVNEWSHP